MLRIILKILTFSLPLIVNPAYTQEIWTENFPVPGKGIWGKKDGKIESDLSGIETWSLDTTGISLSGPDDYAKTVSTSGGRFECRDIDGEVTWISEIINIPASEKVNICLTASETGSGNNPKTKYLKAFVKLDGGIEMPMETNPENYGNWGSIKSEQTGVCGKNIQIICRMRNHYANDKVILDEVTVWKKEEPAPPVYKNEILINEILFNPFPGGEDFVELFNCSGKDIRPDHLYLANRDKNMELKYICPVSCSVKTFSPGSYLAITKDIESVSRWYNIECPLSVVRSSKMPSFNNDEGYVVLLNDEMKVIDEMYYNENMHSPFIKDEEGISLERISLMSPANKPGNWHSASTASGYATPGYKNSQEEDDNINEPQIIFEPEAFSPNNYGFNDQFLIHYQMDKPGYSANIKLYDANGRFVMTLANNEILGISGTIIWNGEDETGLQQLPGVYIIIVVIINSKGYMQRFKDAVVLTE